MCGRFAQNVIEEEVLDLFDLPPATNFPANRANYNGAPTQKFIICRNDDHGQASLARVAWGLVPFWSKDRTIGARLINARSETVAEKPSFKYAFRQRRCLVPANGWFEWQRQGNGKQPYFIQLAEGLPMAFAGIWETWAGEENVHESFALLTRQAVPDLEDIHHRQPVVVKPGDFASWIKEGNTKAELMAVINAEPPIFDAWPVSSLVNNARNNVPEVMARTNLLF